MRQIRDNLDAILQQLPEIMRGLFGTPPVLRPLEGLTMVQFRALRFITEQAGCTMSELAHALGVTLGAATGIVERLHHQGLVSRESDPSDRRRVCVRLTELGRQIHLKAVQRARQRMRRALATLSPEQQTQVATALQILQEALGKKADES